MLSGKTIFITGGTGSFGQYFIKTILKKHTPHKIIIYSRDEMKQYIMQQDPFFSKYISADNDLLRFFIGDIRDLSRLKMAMKGVDYVVHAAALKQVPATEYNPFEVVKTNINEQGLMTASIRTRLKKRSPIWVEVSTCNTEECDDPTTNSEKKFRVKKKGRVSFTTSVVADQFVFV